ncbi:unnamed protein product [Closterium sp. NIES-64]|nr:unnamed protein product [Closterium sp. NIES-64]
MNLIAMNDKDEIYEDPEPTEDDKSKDTDDTGASVEAAEKQEEEIVAMEAAAVNGRDGDDVNTFAAAIVVEDEAVNAKCVGVEAVKGDIMVKGSKANATAKGQVLREDERVEGYETREVLSVEMPRSSERLKKMFHGLDVKALNFKILFGPEWEKYADGYFSDGFYEMNLIAMNDKDEIYEDPEPTEDDKSKDTDDTGASVEAAEKQEEEIVAMEAAAVNGRDGDDVNTFAAAIVVEDEAVNAKCVGVEAVKGDIMEDVPKSERDDFSGEQKKFMTPSYLNLNPLPHLLPVSSDMLIACDRWSADPKAAAANGGFYMARSNDRVLQFFDYWLDAHTRNAFMRDAFTRVRPEADPYTRDTLRLSVHYLPTDRFGSFCQIGRLLRRLVTVHANCCLGLEGKMRVLQQVG